MLAFPLVNGAFHAFGFWLMAQRGLHAWKLKCLKAFQPSGFPAFHHHFVLLISTLRNQRSHESRQVAEAADQPEDERRQQHESYVKPATM